VTDDLAALTGRIDALARRPDAVRVRAAAVFSRLFRLFGWQPELETERLGELVARIGLGPSSTLSPTTSSETLLRRAVAELAKNVSRVERAVVIRGRAPDGYTGWLWRMARTLRLAREWVDRPERRDVLRALMADFADRALTCLGGGGVDPLIDAAFAETRLLGRQRRLLEAARELLLQASAGAGGTEAARARQRLVTRRLARLDRLEAAGVLVDVDLVYQAGEARARGEVQRLHAVLVALEESATVSGDDELARLAEDALGHLWTTDTRASGSAARRSLEHSGRQVFDDEVRRAVARAYENAPGNLARAVAKRREKKTSEEFFVEAAFWKDWREYFQPSGVEATLSGALAVGGCFELGAAASPARVAAGARAVLVRPPNERMVLESAEGLDDLSQALIGDPRLLLPDLAAGKLLARRYVERRSGPGGGGHGLVGEARIYVLDGSSSMLGPRARMRDALLVAELATRASRTPFFTIATSTRPSRRRGGSRRPRRPSRPSTTCSRTCASAAPTSRARSSRASSRCGSRARVIPSSARRRSSSSPTATPRLTGRPCAPRVRRRAICPST
jgi:hypothetical protein